MVGYTNLECINGMTIRVLYHAWEREQNQIVVLRGNSDENNNKSRVRGSQRMMATMSTESNFDPEA